MSERDRETYLAKLDVSPSEALSDLNNEVCSAKIEVVLSDPLKLL